MIKYQIYINYCLKHILRDYIKKEKFPSYTLKIKIKNALYYKWSYYVDGNKYKSFLRFFLFLIHCKFI